jgi:hypothetical protein
MQTVLETLNFRQIARSAIPNIPSGIDVEDLEQQARIFAIELQAKKPGKSDGYYAKACIFHLRNWTDTENYRLNFKSATVRYLYTRSDWNQFTEEQYRLLDQEVQKTTGETREILDLFLDRVGQVGISICVKRSQGHVSKVIQSFVSRTREVICK